MYWRIKKLAMRKKKSLFNKISTYLRIAFLIIIVVVLGACSFLPQEEEVLAPPLVEPAQLDHETVEVEIGEIVRRVSGAGVMISTSIHDLYYSKDGGRLKGIQVNEGETVEEGQVLAEIETGDLSFDIEQLNIELKKAELRLQQMQSQGADKYALEIGKLDIAGLNNRLSHLNSQLASAKIIAPTSGVVAFVTGISQGEHVTAYESMIRIAETDELQIEYTAINEKDIEDVNIGMEVLVTIQGEEMSGKVIQTPKEVPSELYQENPELYSKTLIISSESLPEGVNAGDIAQVEVITAEKQDVLIIPRNGLRTIAGRNYVQVMVDNTRRELDIEVGIISSTEVEVVDGLVEGDTIILQ